MIHNEKFQNKKKFLEICNHIHFSEVEAVWWKTVINNRTYQANQPQPPWRPIITTGYKGNQQQTPKDITKMYILRPEVYIKDPFLTHRFKLMSVQPRVENTKCFIKLTSQVKCGCLVWTLLYSQSQKYWPIILLWNEGIKNCKYMPKIKTGGTGCESRLKKSW